jgi:plastocyanin
MKITAKRLGRLAAVALSLTLVGVGVLAAPAGAHSGTTPHTWHVQVGAQSRDEAIQTMAYYPKHLWIDQGDSVTWFANAAEIHTVTFFSTASPCPPSVLCAPAPGGFNPGDMRQSTPQGGTTYDGTGYFNSGLLSTAAAGAFPLPPFATLRTQYTLLFPKTLKPGDYHYICLVHGQVMSGTVTVRTAGTPYPFSQRDYDRQARKAEQADIRDGYRLWAHTAAEAARLNRKHGPTVLIGAMDERAMVMRFVPSHLTVHVGASIAFVSNAMDTPHTVTFGSDETGCGAPMCDPTEPWNVTKTADGNLAANFPGHNGGFTGNPANLNTGVMLALPPAVTGLPERLTLRTTAKGTFPYLCALHDSMGMLGSITVKH